MANYSITNLLNSQGLLICPVCGKEFNPNDDTMYIIAGGYTCSWKCFRNESKRREAAKELDKKEKVNAKKMKGATNV